MRDSHGSIRFNRHEFSGAFGDLGTDLPLIVGMILAVKLDSASVLILFGLMQVMTALIYRMPMPVQPLKAMAALVITQKIAGNTLYGAGLAIGVVMLLLTVTGLVAWLVRIIPKPVIRGIQFGLGLQLATIALRDYVRSDGASGYWLAGAGFAVTVLLIGRKQYPSAVILVLLGAVYAFALKMDSGTITRAAGFRLPQLHVPGWGDILTGFVVLALPQIPLSLANSILATRQIAEDLFPERQITARRISFTYSLMNLINPFFGGVPTCHGAGGMAGHYAFGGRTGGSVIIYGSMYLVLGLFLSAGFDKVIGIFPMPILGVLLTFEGLTLMGLIRDITQDRGSFLIAVLVGVIAGTLPYGYLVGMVVGAALVALARKNLVSFGQG